MRYGIKHGSIQRGISLVELMISLALGLLIMAALTTLFIDVSRTNQEMAKTNSQVENARFALQLLQDDFVHAGFWGGFVPQFDDLAYSANPADEPTIIPAPCEAYANWDANGDGVLDVNDPYVNGLLGIPVQFYNGVPAGCSGLITNKKSGTDVVVVRHAELCLPGDANCEADIAGKLYFQPSRCQDEIDAGSRYVFGTTGFTLRNRPCVAGLYAPKRKFISHIYYVRNYAVTAGDGIPTLMRAEFDLVSGAPAFTPAVPLIEGIEDFRIELGVDSVSDSGGAVNYAQPVIWADPEVRDSPTNRGDGVPESYVHCAGGCSVDQLSNVSAAKIFVLARASQATPGYTDTKTYKLGVQPALGPYNDGFKRHVFSTTVRFVNITTRRETP